MQHTIVLGTSMIMTMASLGFVAPDNCCYEGSYVASLCLMQPSPPDLEFGRKPPNPEHRRTVDPEGRDPRGERSNLDKIPPRTVDRVMEIAKELDPEFAEQLTNMCHDDPEAFKNLIRRQGRRLRSLVQLRESDPDLFEVKLNELKIDAEISLITKSIRVLGVDEAVSQAQIATLRGLVRAKTALRLRVQTLSIDRLEKHIAALREKIANTSARFDEVVEEQVQQLLNPTKSPSSDK